MKVAVHIHHNTRYLCDIDLTAQQVRELVNPPPLKPRGFVSQPRWNADRGAFEAVQAPIYAAEDHVVKVATPHGDLILFPVTVNGKRLVVTPTPETALANTAPASGA